MTRDEWTTAGIKISDPETLQNVRDVIDSASSVIVEHRFYRGSRAPFRFVCEEAEDFEEYLRTKAAHGDSFRVWNFEECCNEQNLLVAGKVPDAQGRTPVGGAY